METFLRDVRIGMRVLVKERAFCSLAVIVLGLGICGVTTMFSVVNGVMLRGFSFPNADRLASANFIDPSSTTFFGANGRISSMDYEELLAEQQSFERLAAYLNGSTVNVTVDGRPQRYTGAYTTDQFLRILGVSPVLGRDFTAEDNKPGAPKVALIGYGIWQRDFGGSGDIVGRAVRINGKPATIIGVMPSGFAFPTNEELWIPLYSEFPPKPRNDPAANAPAVLGLLKAGVSIDTANAEFAAFASRFAKAYPDTNKQFTAAQVEPLITTFTPRPIRGTLWTMLAFCVGVLLIACVNVMNMQFARATLRARELAVRASLGATRGTLLRQMLTESLLVSTIGAAFGVALAFGSIAWLTASVRALDNPPPSWITFDVSPLVLAISVAATLGSAVASGLVPAWMASRGNAVDVLRDAGRGNTSRSVTIVARGLVVFQIVVTCVLLVGSMLQLRSILKQQRIDYGYDTRGLLSARMALMDGSYPTSDARKTFYDRLVRELAADPQFESVGLTNRFRMVFSGNSPIEIEGRTYVEDRDRRQANWELVTAGYFDVTAQRVLEGRSFRDDDLDAKLPVAVVNAAFARKYFGGESPLGRRFRTVDGNTKTPGPWRTVVGVVPTVRMLGPFNTPNVDASGFYLPFYSTPTGPAQAGPLASQFATVLVKPRGAQRADTLATRLRQDVQKIDADLPLYFVGTPAAQLDAFVAQNRIIATMFTIFGLVAVVLASVGIYGVMSFSVNQRTQEFGVRMALGANAMKIIAMVMRQGAAQVVAGVALGFGLAFAAATALGNAIQNTLFGVTARDPITYGVVFAVVAAVSVVATLVPAQRATHVDPMVALRAE